MAEVLVTRERVTAPPDRFIKVADESLVSFFQGVFLPQQQQEISTLHLLMDGLCSMNFKEVQRRLEGSFSFFAAAAAGKVPKEHRGGAEALNRQEIQFLGDFWEVMKAAHYKSLGRQEWEMALQEDFICTLPVSVDYGSMDSQLLRRFWGHRGGEGREDAPPELGDRIMVFHRGVGVARMKGSYLNQKIDYLLTFWLLEPMWRAIAWIMHLLRLRTPAEAPAGLVPDTLRMQSMLSVPKEQLSKESKGEGPAVPAARGVPAAHAGEALAGAGSGPHQHAVSVERRTFARVFPDGTSVLKKLFKKVSLQEASFEDVVVLYRAAPQAQRGQQGDFDLVSDSDPAVLSRNMHIKHFKGVPLADLDLVLPDRTVHLSPTVLVSTLVTVILGLVAVLGMLFQGKLTAGVLWNVLLAGGTRAMQVYVSATNQRTLVEKQLGKMLYSHTAASQEAVLQTLTEEVGKQRARELFVCYCILLHTFHPLTAHQLDHKCEHFLARQFGLHIDFTAEHALPVLLRWGLVTQDEAGLLHAVPLQTALQKLDETWDSLFDFSEQAEAQQLAAQGGAAGGSQKSSLFSLKLPSPPPIKPMLKPAMAQPVSVHSAAPAHSVASHAGPATPSLGEGGLGVQEEAQPSPVKKNKKGFFKKVGHALRPGQ